MKVNGFRIQSALRDLDLKKQTAATEFEDSLKVFANEQKPRPETTMEGYSDAEKRLAQLQEIQTRYNLAVVVAARLSEKNTLKISLQHAIKLVGSAARIEKLWRDAAVAKKTRSYYKEDTTAVRSKDNEYAQAVLTPSEIASHIRNASRFVSALREAIQIGNATAIDLEVPVDLFE